MSDRLARNSIDGGRIIYLLDTGKLQDLKFPTFWFENTPQGKFMLSIAFGQSKYYVDNLSENIKRGLHYKLKLGIWPTKAPPGYINNPKTREIDIDCEKSKVVKKVFEMFSQGHKSFTKIIQFLHKFGVRGYTGKPIKIEQLKSVILTNPFYIGIMKYGGEMVEGKHKTFISKDLFQKAQSAIKRFEKPRYNGHNFAFSGLARCGECGAVITAETHTKYYKRTDRKVRYVYYRCTKKLGKCDQKYIGEGELESQLRRKFLNLALPDVWKNNWLSWLTRDKEREEGQMKENIIRLELEVKSLEEKLNKLLDIYLEGNIDQESYKSKKNEIFAQKQTLQDKIARVKEKGSLWLEPFENFIQRAFRARKIASSKNNPEELCSLGRSACSNFNLLNRQISFTPYLGWDTVFSFAHRLRSMSPSALNSYAVLGTGFEPM